MRGRGDFTGPVWHGCREMGRRRQDRDQPRPALGRLPWFALLRRARSLRLFAFAMERSLPGTPLYPVWHAGTPVQRLAGIGGAPHGYGVIMGTSSLHGFGLSAPLSVLWLDGDGTILAMDTLRPGHVVRHRGAVWAIELPASVSVDAVPGDAVVLVQSSTPWRAL